MRPRATERFVIDGPSCCTFYEVRTAQPHERCALDHQDDVAQCREICPTRNAHSHDRGDLWNLQIMTHYRVVVEDPCGAVLTREYTALIREIYAG